jgi:hypothetical protein
MRPEQLLAKVKAIAVEIGPTDLEKFTAILDYCVNTFEPAWVARIHQSAEEKEWQRVRTLTWAMFEGFGFLPSQKQVPTEKWQDLCPLYLKGIVALIDSDSSGQPSDRPPQAWMQAQAEERARRNSLVTLGYWDQAEVDDWGQMGH